MGHYHTFSLNSIVILLFYGTMHFNLVELLEGLYIKIKEARRLYLRGEMKGILLFGLILIKPIRAIIDKMSVCHFFEKFYS